MASARDNPGINGMGTLQKIRLAAVSRRSFLPT